jgi:HlyD family secretion protein
MPSNALDTEGRSLRNHLIAGTAVALFLTVGIGGWAFRTELAGAVTASGSVVVDSNVKKVQHLTGGIVGQLLVREGDRVEAGDTVVRLDDTVLQAGLAIVTKGLDEMRARKARLVNERDGSETIVFPSDMIGRTPSPALAAAMDSERKLSICAGRRGMAKNPSFASALPSSRTKRGAMSRCRRPRLRK